MGSRIESADVAALELQAELLELLRASVYPDAGAEGLRLVLAYCKALGVDPLQKPVHLVQREIDAGGRDWALLPGIGLYRTIAARTGCAGTSEPEFGPDVSELVGGVQITHPLWCRVSVRRRLATGEMAEFSAKEFWRENYARCNVEPCPDAPNGMWSRRPYGQLAKCTEAQALRRAFPEIGAQPVADELEGKPLLQSAAPLERPAAAKPAVPMPQARAPAREPFDDAGSPVAVQCTATCDGGEAASGPAVLRAMAPAELQETKNLEADPDADPEADPPTNVAAPLATSAGIAFEAATPGFLMFAAPVPAEEDTQVVATPAVFTSPASRNDRAADEDPEADQEPLAPSRAQPARAVQDLPVATLADRVPREDDAAVRSPLVTAGEQAYLAKRLICAGQSLAELAARAGVAPLPPSLAGLTQTQFLALLRAMS